MQGRLFFQVGNINMSFRITFYYYHLHAGQYRRGWIGAMRGDRDQHDIPKRLSPVFMISPDSQQSRIFALGATVGLKRTGGEAGDAAEVIAEFVDDLMITFNLIGRRERMYGRKFRPAYRNKFRGGIEFHGTASQRDHRRIQGKILILQHFDIAHHFTLTVMGVENLLLHKFGMAFKGLRYILQTTVHIKTYGSHMVTGCFFKDGNDFQDIGL